MSIAARLAGSRVCICVGAGGAGKTTIAASIALGMAARGAKVAVITIDPARRLAESLGLEKLGNEPVPVPSAGAALAAGSRGTGSHGELWAMMLDVRRTLDEIVELLVPDQRARSQLLGNRIYQQLANAVAGTQEFTAVVKLYELYQAGNYDLLVLDTPPSRNALDFLDAPDRLTRFLGGRALRTMLRPAGFGARAFSAGSAGTLRLLTRITGIELLEDVAGFLEALGEVRAGFYERAEQVRQLLRDPVSAFVLVTAAEPEPTDEAIFLARTLRSAGMRVACAVINRVHHDELQKLDGERLSATVRGALGPSLTQRVVENAIEYHAQVERSRAEEGRLARAIPEAQAIRVPQLDRELHSIDGLSSLARFLFASQSEHRRLMADVVS